jgi:hypothetical protein
MGLHSADKRFSNGAQWVWRTKRADSGAQEDAKIMQISPFPCKFYVAIRLKTRQF